MRRFYTFFALKEAYIKLVGEGLLAPWIKKCEFRNVRAPKQGTAARCSTHGVWGGKVTGGVPVPPTETQSSSRTNGVYEEQLEIWLGDEEIADVKTEVQAFEENFMIATMVRPASILAADQDFLQWHRVDLETDILDRARVQGN
jgi:4'-phosphopantetheinyl transferase